MESIKNNSRTSREDVTCENLQLKLKEKIHLIEEAIQNVSVFRKDLKENSKNVKIEVQKSIASKIEQMRQREMQLLRQVDALIGHQSALLQMHLSHLYQTLGSFKAASQWADLGSKVFKLPTLNEEDLETVSPCLIHYQSDDNLSMTIQLFGSLEAKGTPAKVFLLPDEEEYGDGDHHVLHKTIQEENQTKIKVAFPKLNGKLEDWLPPESHGTAKQLQDFEISSSRSSISDVSDSIEIVSHSDLHENQEWLSGNKILMESTCNCQDLGNIEIENLDTLSCIPITNVSNLSKVKTMGESFLKIPSVYSVCKSNATEKCSSFENSLCDNECLFANLKERLVEMEIRDTLQQQDCINTAIRNNFSKEWLCNLDENIFNDHSWLSSISKSKGIREDWLVKPELPVDKETSKKETSKKFQFPHSLQTGDLSVWIKENKNSKKDISEKLDEAKEVVVPKSMESSLWLFEKSRNFESNNLAKQAIKSTFDIFLKPLETDTWLMKSCHSNPIDRSG